MSEDLSCPNCGYTSTASEETAAEVDRLRKRKLPNCTRIFTSLSAPAKEGGGGRGRRIQGRAAAHAEQSNQAADVWTWLLSEEYGT